MLNYDLSLFNEGVEDLKQDIKRMRSSARKKKKKNTVISFSLKHKRNGQCFNGLAVLK